MKNGLVQGAARGRRVVRSRVKEGAQEAKACSAAMFLKASMRMALAQPKHTRITLGGLLTGEAN